MIVVMAMATNNSIKVKPRFELMRVASMNEIESYRRIERWRVKTGFLNLAKSVVNVGPEK